MKFPVFAITFIFLTALIVIFLYLVFWSYFFTGDWRLVSFSTEAPLAAIAAFLAPMIFITIKIFPSGLVRSQFVYGFAGIIIVLLFVMAYEKYAFIFPQEDQTLRFQYIEPIIFTISALFLLRGVKEAEKLQPAISD